MEKKSAKGKKADLLHHPEHLCSITVNSCGAEDRAKLEIDPSTGKEKDGAGKDICTPLFGGT